MIVSKSDLEAYSDCPRKWYYKHCPGIPKKTNYPQLCGIEVHRHVAQFYRATREPRPFFWKTKKSAINAWFNRWERALNQAEIQKKLILPDKDKAKDYGKIGCICIANYWNDNIKAPRPLQIEQHYQTRLDNGVSLRGVFDQVRQVSSDWIERHRPELVKKEELAKGYENIVIVDLKTGYPSYDYYQFKEDPSLMEKIRLQYELHENLQATLYSFLYEKVNGKRPVGFVWYHLRSKKTFFTYRENRDYLVLSDIIDHFLENVKAQSFPKHSGKHCRFCDYIKACREDRYFLVVEPEELLKDLKGEVEIVPNVIKKDPYRQLKLKLTLPRKKKKKPIIYSKKEEKPIVLRNLPWDEKKKLLVKNN